MKFPSVTRGDTPPASGPIPSPALAAYLKSLYHYYRLTPHIPTRCERFLSPHCSQICRPMPTYAADHSRDTIARYLREAADAGQTMFPSDLSSSQGSKTERKLHYSIRPVTEAEVEFTESEGEARKNAGLPVNEGEMRTLVEREGWAGMRVDLWDEMRNGEEGEEGEKGMLVKVIYWWRKEGEEGWMQILHDIMSIGPRDGNEGEDMEVVE